MTASRLTLAPGVAKTVLEHSLETAPDECCGILVGPAPDHATQARPAENVHTNPRTEYEIDPEALLEAVQDTAETDLEIVGFYHSHPRGAAAFSKTDRARGSWEGTTYLLCSLAPLTFLAGRWDGEGFDPVDLAVDIDADHL